MNSKESTRNSKTCIVCGNEFVSGRPSQRYCSQLCYRVAVRKEMQQYNQQFNQQPIAKDSDQT
jgi:predicted nucleic acid-binding Zn ribbon protein